jgi:hypothetical protein
MWHFVKSNFAAILLTFPHTTTLPHRDLFLFQIFGGLEILNAFPKLESGQATEHEWKMV